MSHNIIDVLLLLSNIAEAVCLIYLARRLSNVEKNQLQMRLTQKQAEVAEKNIQSDLEKRLFDIQNIRYARSYSTNILNNKDKRRQEK